MREAGENAKISPEPVIYGTVFNVPDRQETYDLLYEIHSTAAPQGRPPVRTEVEILDGGMFRLRSKSPKP